jgi:hypothetical protein
MKNEEWDGVYKEDEFFWLQIRQKLRAKSSRLAGQAAKSQVKRAKWWKKKNEKWRMKNGMLFIKIWVFLIADAS